LSHGEDRRAWLLRAAQADVAPLRRRRLASQGFDLFVRVLDVLEQLRVVVVRLRRIDDRVASAETGVVD
jgi:hypothetical protein